MHLFGQGLSRRELESFVADVRQIADVRLMTFADGPERGVRAALVQTGSGLEFTVLLDRAMDIGPATFYGIPLAWQSGTGPAHPSRYEADGLNWLRTFHGGLVALCGLTQAGYGADNVDPHTGESLGLHGRIGAIPARDVAIDRIVTDESIVLRLRGTMDEIRLFGHKLHLARAIEVRAGSAEIRLTDQVRNSGGSAAPLMVLYHCNFGWPLVSPGAEMTSPAARIEPRDEAAAEGLADWNQMGRPVAGYREQVFWHYLDRTAGSATACIWNPALSLGVALDFNPQELGFLTQWKQMGFGDYTLGIEPGNCQPVGQVAAREQGTLFMLPPGESVSFHLTIRVVQSRP
jgi:hypothetical protein